MWDFSRSSAVEAWEVKRGLGVEAGAGVERREGGLVGGLEVDIVGSGGGEGGGVEDMRYCMEYFMWSGREVWMEFW